MFKLSKEKNRLLKQLIVLSVVLLGSFVCLALIFGQSSYVTDRGHFKEQPLAFSHRTHTHDVGIDCIYCHTQPEKSPQSDLPTTETCYGCHQDVLKTTAYLDPVRSAYQKNDVIKWNRVNLLANHVYFNHSKHLKRNISCETCHGDVTQMPKMTAAHDFTMQWCLSCHRTYHENEKAEDVINRDLKGCYTCHR
ncbi:cytochrome c3 family protein [Peredibacter starrii]|uniref:Cytochrome c3 family protein n=1 Tax=Peredibacter starrii TaxID=28202 RepID=A0AAX4HS86_9BACT|nr:cytochrome c3 family protein [Peredibacter starrii]WPU66072.1 cytochrome c3 family protein [Peredibacter starrii]